MIRLATETDLVMIQDYPDQLQSALLEVLKVLDDNYGSDRNVMSDYGGYIILTMAEEDLPQIERDLNIEITVDGVPEYVDVIRCENKETYTSSLFLLGSDYGVMVVMPYSTTPANLLQYTE